jgi:hypothetical protein
VRRPDAVTRSAQVVDASVRTVRAVGRRREGLGRSIGVPSPLMDAEMPPNPAMQPTRHPASLRSAG